MPNAEVGIEFDRAAAGLSLLWHALNAGAEFRNPGRRSGGLLIRVIVVCPPERWEVPAKVQFEVAPKTVADITDLGTARLRTGRGQG